MSDLQELLRQRRPPNQAELLRLIARVAEAVERHEKRIDSVYERLLLVDALPANAPLGALIRLRQGTVAERTALYLGNGPNLPLSRLVPVAL